MNGLLLRGLSLMQRARDELLPRSALALDQHGAAHRRHLLDLHEHLAHRLALADQSRLDRETSPIENAADPREHLIQINGLRVHLHEADRAQPVVQRGVDDVCESHRGHSIPQQIAHELHVARVDESTGEHDDVGRLAANRRAHIVDRAHERRLVACALEHRVQPDRGLDIRERDQNLHCPFTSPASP